MSNPPPATPQLQDPDAARERTLALALMGALTLFYAVSATVWALTDRVAPMWDQARHALDALRLLDAMRDVVHGHGKIGDIGVWHDNYYVFLGYLPTSLAHLVFGTSWEVAKVMMALFWTPLGLVSTWYLARRLLDSTLGAFVATAWLASSPLMADFSKDYLVDLPILSVLALFLALLVRSNYLKHPWWAAACGMAAGCIVLVKAVAPGVFVVMPAALAAVHVWRTDGFSQRKKGIAFAFMAWAFCALPVHIRWWPEFMMARHWQTQHAMEEGDPTSLWPSTVAVVKQFVDLQARGLLIPWLIVGMVQLWRSRRNLVLASLACFLFCEAVWIWYPNKDVRFPFPGLVFLAVPAGGLLWNVGRPKWRLAGAAAVFGFAVFSTWAVQWGFSFLPHEVALATGWRVFAQEGYLRGRPDPSPNMPQALMAPIKDDPVRLDAAGDHRRPMVHLDFTHDEPHFNVWDLHHVSYMAGHLYDMEDPVPADWSHLDYLVQARCAGENANPPAGFEPMHALDTPQGCLAHLYRNAALYKDEKTVRAAPRIFVKYKAQYMVQTLEAVTLDAPELTAGQEHRAVFLMRVDSNRWSTNLKRRLLLGGQVLTEFVTTEHGYQRNMEYVFAVRFVVPAQIAPGTYPLQMVVQGPTGLAMLLESPLQPPGSVFLEVATVQVNEPLQVTPTPREQAPADNP